MKPYLHRSTALGAGVFLLCVLAALTGFIDLGALELLFLLAPLVIIPIGFGLLTDPAPPLPLRIAFRLQPFAAVLAAVSFIPAPGPAAAALAAPWFLVTCLAALAGLAMLKSGPLTIFALFFLPVGGIHLIVSRLGIDFLGFTEPILILTAVHFHYTGFGAPLLAARAAARVRNSRILIAIASIGLIAAPPLVAAGFAFSSTLQTGAVLALSVGIYAAAFLQFKSLPSLASRPARDFLTLSSVSVLAGMALAVIYAVGEYTGARWIDIPMMGRTHGLLNGVGFILCGLLGWRFEAKSSHRATETRRSERKETVEARCSTPWCDSSAD